MEMKFLKKVCNAGKTIFVPGILKCLIEQLTIHLITKCTTALLFTTFLLLCARYDRFDDLDDEDITCLSIMKDTILSSRQETVRANFLSHTIHTISSSTSPTCCSSKFEFSAVVSDDCYEDKDLPTDVASFSVRRVNSILSVILRFPELINHLEYTYTPKFGSEVVYKSFPELVALFEESVAMYFSLKFVD